MSAATHQSDPAGDSSSLLGRRPYAFFLAGRFLGTLATGSQAVVIAWEVYELARQTMSLAEAAFAVGMIGLAQFLPLFALTLVAGETADRHDRRQILTVCYLAQLVISAGLAFRSALGGGLWPIFALAALFGCARAFFQPTASALGPMWCRSDYFPSDRDQFAGRPACEHPRPGPRRTALRRVAGSRLRGKCRAVRCRRELCMMIHADTRPPFESGRSRAAHIREGLGYVWGNKLVLGAISLDLFAVLLGGATGLLPVFARDVLEVGPRGFGILRASPAVGALMVAVYLAYCPIRTGAGVKMLLAVGLFGLMTVVFAFSDGFPCRCSPCRSSAALTWCRCYPAEPGADRHPDRMRGRVSAVSTSVSSGRQTNWGSSRAG